MVVNGTSSGRRRTDANWQPWSAMYRCRLPDQPPVKVG